ncbi:hypothetical protein P7C70_g3681, partial [Phenoliferia sp. Uapishka_3]
MKPPRTSAAATALPLPASSNLDAIPDSPDTSHIFISPTSSPVIPVQGADIDTSPRETSRPNTSFKPTLLRFLSYLSPSLTLYYELFLHAGLTNRSRIANLLCMENAELEEFFASLEAGVEVGGGIVIAGLKPFLLKSVFLKNLERVRRELKEGLRVAEDS